MEIKDSKRDKLLKALHSQKLMNELGLAVIQIIKERTRRGSDIEGKSYGEYSKSYIKVRERHGLPTSPVTMTFDDVSGMMQKIDHLVATDFSNASVFIDDRAKEQIARYWNMEGAGRKKMIRTFWGISLKSELDKLAALGFKILKDVLRKL
jgi:hypothetical protein